MQLFDITQTSLVRYSPDGHYKSVARWLEVGFNAARIRSTM